MRSRALVTVFTAFVTLFGAIRLSAQVVDYTWSGAITSSWTNPGNWVGNVAPPNSLANTRVIFGNVSSTEVRLNMNDFEVHALSISGNKVGYYFNGNFDGLSSLADIHLGPGGLAYAPSQPAFTSFLTDFTLENSQTWNIASGTVAVQGRISDYVFNGETFANGNFQMEKTGAGTLQLEHNGSDSWDGGLLLTAGKLVVQADYYSNPITPFGYGTLTFNGGTLVARPHQNNQDSKVHLENNIVSNGLISTHNEAELHLGYSGEGSSTIELAADTTINTSGRMLFLDGNIEQTGGTLGTPRSLTMNSNGTVVLNGYNSYTGGTIANKGILVFANANANPGRNLDSMTSGLLTATANGYIGYGDDVQTTNPQGDFIDYFNKAATTGTIGFDTDPSAGSPTTYSGNIDLSAVPTGTAFASTARLSSATRAILSGTITPQGTSYRFGGGGGVLQVDSQLTGARDLVLDSPAARPLTLKLTNGTNDYSGGTSVTNSGLIFTSNLTGTTFPGGTRNISINAGGYVGFQNWGDQTALDMVNNSLLKIHTASTGAVGFDSVGTLSAPIDLSAFTNGLYLATNTPGGTDDGVYGGVRLSGLITPAGGASAPYRFAGYKGGLLIIESALSGAGGVKIGDPNSPGTFGDFVNEEYSKVALTGNNSALTGDVTLYGGELYVGLNSPAANDITAALGTGKLIVQGMALPSEWQDLDGSLPSPQLSADYLTTIPNDVVLNTRLNIADSSTFELSGKISGTGGLHLQQSADLTLSNDANTFSGGITLGSASNLDLDADHAAGTGMLTFLNDNWSEVYFNTAAPVLGGLNIKGDNNNPTLYATLTNTVLTINQAVDGKFNGEFRSDAPWPADNLRILKSGAGTLSLIDGGMYFYHGTTEASLAGTPDVSLQVNQGTLSLGENFYMESSAPTVWVHGGTLNLETGANLYNPVVVDNGGRVTGGGLFASNVVIGTGAIVAPGSSLGAGIGHLQFNELTLAPNGVFEWNLNAATPDVASSFDQINILAPSTLFFTSDSTNRFTLKLITLNLDGTMGTVNGFDGSRSYTWDLITSSSTSGLFDPANFLIDTSQFSSNLSGAFSLGLNGSNLQLTFQPVPEPSTYALLGLGLGMIGLGIWRKRRSA